MNMMQKFDQVIPNGATHHIVQDGQVVYFRNDTKPHQKFVGGDWCDMYQDANVAKWAWPVDMQPKQMKSIAEQKLSGIYSNNRYKGD